LLRGSGFGRLAIRRLDESKKLSAVPDDRDAPSAERAALVFFFAGMTVILPKLLGDAYPTARAGRGRRAAAAMSGADQLDRQLGSGRPFLPPNGRCLRGPASRTLATEPIRV
jgi:hypothetical protein